MRVDQAVVNLRRNGAGWLAPQLPGPHRSSGTNGAGISASNMLPPHDGTARLPW
jgi:hypothetical protein